MECKKNHYIYQIKNVVNNKIYIGRRSTKLKIEDDIYMGSGKLLHKAFIKYGKNNFIKEILFVCDSFEELCLKEEELVNLNFVTSDNTYNLSLGGKGSGQPGITRSDESKINWSNASKARRASPETRAKISAGQLGNKRSLTTRKLQSEIKKGKKLSEDHCRNISKSVSGSNNWIAISVTIEGIVYETKTEACRKLGIAKTQLKAILKGTKTLREVQLIPKGKGQFRKKDQIIL